jgi:hypothetical protein
MCLVKIQPVLLLKIQPVQTTCEPTPKYTHATGRYTQIHWDGVRLNETNLDNKKPENLAVIGFLG